MEVMSASLPLDESCCRRTMASREFIHTSTFSDLSSMGSTKRDLIWRLLHGVSINFALPIIFPSCRIDCFVSSCFATPGLVARILVHSYTWGYRLLALFTVMGSSRSFFFCLFVIFCRLMGSAGHTLRRCEYEGWKNGFSHLEMRVRRHYKRTSMVWHLSLIFVRAITTSSN